MSERTNDPLLAVQPSRAFKMLSVGKNKGYEMIKKGLIPTISIGGMLRVPMSAIQAMIEPQ